MYTKLDSVLFKYGAPFTLSLLLAFFLTPLVRRYAVKYRFVCFPKQDRWRKRVVALLGGIAIFVSFLAPYIIFSAHDMRFIGFIFGALGIFWLGLVDDIVNIKPDTKLIGQIVVACIAVMFGISFNISETPLINIPLTILWVVAIVNAFNLLDNMDGLCAGIAAISSLIMCMYAIINNNAQLIILSVVTLGATVGFLRYNFNPAKIFMGDSGSMFLGYVLSIAALIGSGKERSGLLIIMAIPVLVLAVPIFDTIFVTIVRILNNRPVSQGGKDHTSHRLVTLGLSEKNAVLLLYGISAACGLVALLYPHVHFIYIFMLLAILFIGLFVFGVFLGTEVRVYSPEEIDASRNKKKLNGKIIFNGFIYNKRRMAEVILDFIIVSASYMSAFWLRFEGPLFDLNIAVILQSLPLVVIVKLLTFYSFGLYRGVWRYAGLYDLVSIFKATFTASVMIIMALLFVFPGKNYSRTIFIIDWLITFIAICGVRILFRLYKEFFANIRITGKRVLIFGAGDAGELALREIRQNRSLGYKAIGFIDDDDDKIERVIHGVRVLGAGDDLEKLIHIHKIDELLIAMDKSHRKRFSEVCGICQKTQIPFREVSKMIDIKKENDK